MACSIRCGGKTEYSSGRARRATGKRSAPMTATGTHPLYLVRRLERKPRRKAVERLPTRSETNADGERVFLCCCCRGENAPSRITTPRKPGMARGITGPDLSPSLSSQENKERPKTECGHILFSLFVLQSGLERITERCVVQYNRHTNI